MPPIENDAIVAPERNRRPAADPPRGREPSRPLTTPPESLLQKD
jgi:hypothetical protein